MYRIAPRTASAIADCRKKATRVLPIGKTAFYMLALAFCAPFAAAETSGLPAKAPLPEPRPYAPLGTAASAVSLPFSAGLLLKEGMAELKEGLDALAAGDLERARLVRVRMKPGSLDSRIMARAIAFSGAGGISSEDVAEAAAELKDWPGMKRLRAVTERALYREAATPRDVVEALEKRPPVTFHGTVALGRAYVELGKKEEAREVVAAFWHTQKLDGRQENAILSEFGELLTQADHRHRMEAMLYEDRIRAAERVASLADAEALARAWAAIIRNGKDAAKLLDEVPSAQHSAGYHFAKARYLRRAGRYQEAAEVLLSAPRDPSAQIDTDEWWFERRALSREFLDLGEPETAYRIAAEHSGESALSIADAEFHAGWYALRHLNNAPLAAKHFARIVEVADGPISRARAHYWLGRAAEAGAGGDATVHYERAAAFGTVFYGQLATAKLGRKTLAVASPLPSAEDRRNFAARSAVRAIERLEAAGYHSHADSLYRDLAGELTSAGELALLATKAEQRGDHTLALRVGKIAASRGLQIGALAHPIGAIPRTADVKGAHAALAYAVARQESEFNIAAISGAGARGLLQLMPATARSVAKKGGLSYSPSRLTTDAAYNATLGAAYLAEQLERFDGSYVLTFIGYNAGPRRAEDWMGRYGDPRGRTVEEVVDWIERIPFNETRAYVQRVMENYQVYKSRLTGRFDIVGDLTHGRE
ncbi:lytic transglycosylase domain-containing protein [Chelativorans sp. Marseille-P2723]|uniref:lytic transglycosylase domain-containing protein n=1 Tax=Chelativorans sp. Marseille-P2723 TaxID=2709133 RepID=UPI001FF04476|nr:lytic transglycosylase domain-containing protein [Chelativorans sp. Marseille-P2723]